MSWIAGGSNGIIKERIFSVMEGRRTITKRDLVMMVAERVGMTQNEVKDVVESLLETISAHLAAGNRLEIRNFGIFEVKTREARMGRNPRTGEEVPIPVKRVATFKPGKELKHMVERMGMGEQPQEEERAVVAEELTRSGEVTGVDDPGPAPQVTDPEYR